MLNKKKITEETRFVIKIDRGYIEYSEFYSEIGETQYGVTHNVKNAKKFKNHRANVIVKKFRDEGKYAEKIEVEEDE